MYEDDLDSMDFKSHTFPRSAYIVPTSECILKHGSGLELKSESLNSES